MICAKYEKHDGFELCRTDITLPADLASLENQTRRDLTICHLFINLELTISRVADVLNENRRYIILTLLEKGILKDRRQRPRTGPFISTEMGAGLIPEPKRSDGLSKPLRPADPHP